MSADEVVRSLETGATQVGAPDDGDAIYVELKHATRGADKLLLLKMLWVPEPMRHAGICRRVLDALEQRADREHRLLAVGPIMADNDNNSFLGDLCARRGYTPTPPWMYIRDRRPPPDGAD